jgi:hypothetical protein
MQIEIARMERMAERGSSLLRLMQNSHTPILDLLVRESIQNSLDAAIDPQCPVRYDISIKEFNKEKAVRHFDGIKDKLSTLFYENKQKAIVIRDWNTTGLTGPLHYKFIKNNNFGNLLKLVYEISMPQEKKEAGGSWGLGKTIYFRTGIGLVIYYSRIKLPDGSYQSRLAACLVEDETKEETLLPNNQTGPRRGIAWWGQQFENISTIPLTNEYEINEILNDFNVKPYGKYETGTTVIIPFINTSKLLFQNENGNLSWWHKDIELYLNIAIQRWYSPRIDNKYYQYGSFLIPSVNGMIIDNTNMEPVFSLIRALYIAATRGIDFVEDIYKNNIYVKNIELRRSLSDKLAGRVAFLKADKDTLKMTVPHNKKSPFDYLEISHIAQDYNPPIVAYVRKPAMIVNYETDGKWTNGIEKTDSNEFLIALFVPNSNNAVITENERISLDEYLRRGERADHSSWNDLMINEKKYTIVERLQKNVVRSINEVYKNNNEEELQKIKSTALSRTLARELLPPFGFGHLPSPRKINTDGNKVFSKNRAKGKLHILETKYMNDGKAELIFNIDIPFNAEMLTIEILVDSEGNSKISGDEWEKDDVIGTPFPVEIKSLMFDRDYEGLDINIVRTEKYGVKNFICIKVNDFNGEIKGKIIMQKNDPIIFAYLHEKLHFKRS